MSPRRLGRITVSVSALLLALAPISALAAGQTTITLSSLSSGETFTSTGGVICASGTATTDFDHFGGGPVAGSFHLTKTLTCSDGSGTITILVHAATVFGSPTDQGGWAVVSGTGDYTALSGGGNVVGTYVPDGIIDLYTGVLRN
jgi:hypothetical protein